MDAYGYPAMVWTVFMMQARAREEGWMPLAEGVAQSLRVLETLDRLMPEDAGFLVGDARTLRETHALPMMIYLAETEIGRNVIADVPRMAGWLARMRERAPTDATAVAAGNRV